MSHLGKATDEVRRREYARLAWQDRRFIKGQRDHLLSRRQTRLTEWRHALWLPFRANGRLHPAYPLQESSAPRWDYDRPDWARRFFAHWKDALRWQRLEPCRK